MDNLVIMKDGVALSRSGTYSILSLLTKEDAHFIGTVGKGKVKHGCSRKGYKGYYMGEGVCFLYRFINENTDCRHCVGRSPIEQLNWFFQNVPGYEGFYATWGGTKTSSNFKIEREETKLADCIEFLEVD